MIGGHRRRRSDDSGRNGGDGLPSRRRCRAADEQGDGEQYGGEAVGFGCVHVRTTFTNGNRVGRIYSIRYRSGGSDASRSETAGTGAAARMIDSMTTPVKCGGSDDDPVIRSGRRTVGHVDTRRMRRRECRRGRRSRRPLRFRGPHIRQLRTIVETSRPNLWTVDPVSDLRCRKDRAAMETAARRGLGAPCGGRCAVDRLQVSAVRHASELVASCWAWRPSERSVASVRVRGEPRVWRPAP